MVEEEGRKDGGGEKLASLILSRQKDALVFLLSLTFAGQ